MDRTRLSGEEWEKLFPKLEQLTCIRMGEPSICRRFIEAVLWILRTGAQWRQLPQERGKWNSVFKRYSRWCQYGVWVGILEWLAENSDFQHVSIDSSVIRTHACAAGASGSCAKDEALGRSRGGFSCKIHALSDGLGLPVKFILTEGQGADITQAIPLMEGVQTDALLADKGYDADRLLEWLEEHGIQAVIPPKANRKGCSSFGTTKTTK